MMSITETGISTFTLDCNVKASIRQAVANFHQRCGLQYAEFEPDEALYNECCQEATNRRFPMDGNYSIRPYIVIGVATFCWYNHLPDRATKMWLCLFTAINTCIDDILNGTQDLVHLYRFNERFMNCQPQGDPLLNAFDVIMREATRHYSPVLSNLIITASLDFISSILIEHDTKNMQVLTKVSFYPEYHRLLSGLASGYALCIFPPTVQYQKYIQIMPDLIFIVCAVNDILSFYKEEIVGENGNYVSLVAATRGLTKLDALQDLIEKAMQTHHNILECLKPHPEANDAYVSFFNEYFKFYASLKRYKLDEIMLEESSCLDS